MENDGGKPDGGVRFLGEAEVLVGKSDVEDVNTGIKRIDYGYIDDKHDGSKNRVVELMSGDDGWGMMDLVGRVLNGDHGRDEIDKGNVSENQPEINPVVDSGTIGESTFANAEGNGKQYFLVDDIVQAEKSRMEAIKYGKADVVATSNDGYGISDLVWGKVKSHPWWPGQIFEHSAASNKALIYSKKDRHLIAYFGDHTFAWNDVSKMKPFQVNFAEMEKQSDARAFSYALKCALDEVARRVEVGLSCPCLPVDVLDQIKTQIVANAGINKKSRRREGQDNSFTAASFLPRETAQLVESFAVMPNFITDRLQFAILKAQLLAFNRWRGIYQLSMFELCGFLVDDITEVEGIDPKEVPAASDTASEVPPRKRKHVAQDDEQTAKRMGCKKQGSIVSGSKERKKHIERSLRAIYGMDIQPDKKPRVIQQTTQSDPKQSKTLEMIQPLTLTPDETVEKLNSAAKTPIQEHDNTMMQAVNFLREYRNFTCLKNSSAYGETEHEGENEEKMTLAPDETFEKLDLAAKKPMEEHDDTMTCG